MLIISGLRMMLSNVTRLNIPFMQYPRLWIEETLMIVSWSQDPGVFSDQITNIDKTIQWRRMITNVLLYIGWVIAVI